MFEKVSKHHPDKVADRIGGALVDLAYTRAEGGWAKSNPRIAGELTLGHGTALVILETDADITADDVRQTVQRISGISPDRCHVSIVPQDLHLAHNQKNGLKAGDNGIFRGSPITNEQKILTALAKTMDERFGSDGKYIIRPASYDYDDAPRDCYNLTICQSNATHEEILALMDAFMEENFIKKGRPVPIVRTIINPLGPWTGGLDTDTGAVNRKLGSDMGDAVTGGGIHFKDLSKADVSVNILCHILAQQTGQPVTATCSIGDEQVTFHCEGTGEAFPDNLPAMPDQTIPFADIVERARLYVLTQHGSFEHMAEYGLIS